ncbi:hypothetical protein CYMTET_33654 [Cymbomonas tetramitiformis]|uniref:Uncharacterized protein n=1 Tax=Cymbomonas tetramitiformis TaxID=36881 RepID=A0AAE0FD99_9CHLO|nr:hypothetical protein CYMTET_42151 [Cymbomonas tetramitiformis]KAK3257256.1 hypothetical protein CYMTET_33654 [Cymbomonas tetramitiformis]
MADTFPPLFGCLHRKGCFPNCFPKAVCSPCMILGAVETMIKEEDYIDCFVCSRALHLGSQGFKTCACYAPCGLLGAPSGGGPSPASILMLPIHYKALEQRNRVIEKYGLSTTSHGILQQLCCFSCSMFQVWSYLDSVKGQAVSENTPLTGPPKFQKM